MDQVDFLRRGFWGASLIPLIQAPEPNNFEKRVRVPGRAFLLKTPFPAGAQWKGREYWRNAIPDLRHAYSNICAYCSSYTVDSEQPKHNSVDHFIPKSVKPSLAYEWQNYRLCRARLNNRKDNHQDVLDPFKLTTETFLMDFRTFLLKPNPALSQSRRDLVKLTIKRLALNDDNDYVRERIGAIREYCLGQVTLAQLSTKYPFIAYEMKRQDFDRTFLPQLAPFFNSTT